MKTYDIFSGEELKIAEKIQQRRLQMLVHSRIYYKENQNLISDREWDIYAKELLKLQTDYPDISRQVDWYDAFADWDASTGEFLPLDDEWVVKKARKMIGSKYKKSIVSQNGATKKKSLFDMPIKKQSVKQQIKQPVAKKKSLF